MPSKTPSKSQVFLTGIQPGQNFEQFKANTIEGLRKLGFFAPKAPGATGSSEGASTPALPEAPREQGPDCE